MKRPVYCLFCILCVLAGYATSQNYSVHRFELNSKSVPAKYQIEVVVPAGNTAAGTRYPVVYCMDWYILGDYYKSLPRMMELGRLAEPLILAGISGEPSEDAWAIMRTRDFTPAPPADDYSRGNMYPKAIELAGGAGRFHTFLKNELIPLVEGKYPADPSRRCFAGYSLGGLLGVFIMNRDPELFQYYLLGSPSLWFNDYSVATETEKLPAGILRPVKKVYVSAGEEESWEMLKSFAMLRAALRQQEFSDSRLKTEIIGASGHVGAMPVSLYNGLRFLFKNK